MISEGPLVKFTEGWAVPVFKWGAAHYYERDGVGLAKAVCGAGEVRVALLRGLGSWAQCKRCLKKRASLQHQPDP